MSQGLIQHYLPVFRHYLVRIDQLAASGTPAQLAARLSPDSFTALDHFAIAQGYVLRGLYPLVGLDTPDLPEVTDANGLLIRGDFVRTCLDDLEKTDAQKAGDVTHRAGKTTLTQTPYDYIALYAAPNFFFHASMGYAVLRAQGAQIGKGDFDGFHTYPQGFSFVASDETGGPGQLPEAAQ